MKAVYECKYCKAMFALDYVEEVSRKDAVILIDSEGIHHFDDRTPNYLIPKIVPHNADDHVGLAELIGFMGTEEENAIDG